MNFHHLKEDQLRELAFKLAYDLNDYRTIMDYDKWMARFMSTYDHVIEAYENYVKQRRD